MNHSLGTNAASNMNCLAHLQKAAALKLESRGEDMKLETGEDIREEEVQVAILADLQQKQDEEANILMQDLEAKVNL